MVCIAFGVDEFRGGPCPPLYIRGNRVTWKVLAGYSWSPTTARSGSFLCTAASFTPIRIVYKRGKVHPWAIPYSRTFYSCEQSCCAGSDSSLAVHVSSLPVLTCEFWMSSCWVGLELSSGSLSTSFLKNFHSWYAGRPGIFIFLAQFWICHSCIQIITKTCEGIYQVQTNLSVQTVQTSRWATGSTSKGHGGIE